MSNIAPFGGVPAPRFPTPNITPFTYRDGCTYLEILEAMREWLNKYLVPELNGIVDYINELVSDALESVERDITELRDYVNETVANLEESVAHDIATLIEYVDEAVEQVINSSIEVQRPVIEGVIKEDYGWVNAGLYDGDTVFDKINAAIDDVAPGGTVFVPEGEYHATDLRPIIADKRVTVDFNGSTIVNDRSSGPALAVRGYDADNDYSYSEPVMVLSIEDVTITSSDNPNWVSANTPGTLISVSSAAGIERGDWVKIVSDSPLVGQRSYDSTSDLRRGRYGQHMQVFDIVGNAIRLIGRLRESSEYFAGLRMAKVIGEPITIRDVTVTMTEDAWNDVSNQALGIDLVGLIRPHLDNVTVERSHGGAIAVTSCFAYTFDNPRVIMTRNSVSGETQALGYGVIDIGCEDGVINGLRAGHVRHAFTDDVIRSVQTGLPVRSYGRTYGTKIIDGICHGSSAASWDTHAHGENVAFINCSSYGSAGGFSLRGRAHRVIGGEVVDCQATALQVADEPSYGAWSLGHEFDGVSVDGCTNVIIARNNTGTGRTWPVRRDPDGRIVSGPSGQRTDVPTSFRNIKARRVGAYAIIAENVTVEMSNFSADYDRNGFVAGNGYIACDNSRITANDVTLDIRFAETASRNLVNISNNGIVFCDGYTFLWTPGNGNPSGIVAAGGTGNRFTNGRVTDVIPSTLNVLNTVSYIADSGRRPSSPDTLTAIPAQTANAFRNAVSDAQSPGICLMVDATGTWQEFPSPVAIGQTLTIVKLGSGEIILPDGPVGLRRRNIGNVQVVLGEGDTGTWVSTQMGASGRWYQIG